MTKNVQKMCYGEFLNGFMKVESVLYFKLKLALLEYNYMFT